MNLFSLATRGVDLDALPTEEPARETLTFNPGRAVTVPSELDRVFADAGDAYGVDPAILKSIALTESGFSPEVITGQRKSSAGALGLMQFMPNTAKEYGIDPLNPVEAIFGAAAYMRQSLDKFGGDYGKAVASYNAGRNRKDFDAEDWDQRMPAETQDYLMKVFGSVDQFKDGASERGLPQGVAPSKAGAGRGVVNPGMDAPVTDTGDETARLAARYKAPDAPQQGGFIQSAGDFFKPAPTSVLESYKPTAAEQQAANAQRLRYGAGPIKGDVLIAANEVASGNATSRSSTVNAVAKQMQERGDTFTGYAQSKNTPILKEAARDAKAAEFRSAGEWAVDSIASLAQGASSVPLLPVSIIAPGGDMAKTLRSWRDAWSNQESDVLKAQRAVLKDRIQSEEGFAGKYAATVVELVTNPALGLSEAIKQVPNYLAVIGASRIAAGAVGAGFNAIEKSSPTLALANALSSGAVKGGAQATAATAGGMAASVVMTSGDAAGDVYETLTDPNKTPKKVWEQNEDYQALIKQGLSHKAAVMQIAEAKARFAAVVVAPLGLFGFMGAESALATKGIAGLAASLGPKAAAKTFGKEIIGENIEEGGTKLGGNVVTSTVDPRVKWDEGVAEAAATATVTSAPMAGLAARSQWSAPPAQAQDSRNGLIAAGLLDPQTYDGGLVGAAGTANPLLEQLKRKPAPTVESQPTTPQAPPVTPAAPDSTQAAGAVDRIQAILEAERNADTTAAPVPAGSQTTDAGTAPVDAGAEGASAGPTGVAAADDARQPEPQGALTQPSNFSSTPTATIGTQTSVQAGPGFTGKGIAAEMAALRARSQPAPVATQPATQQAEQPRTTKAAQPAKANLDPQGLLSDDERQMLGEFTRLYQTDLKADIRQRLGMTPKEQATAQVEKKKPSALLSLIVQMGGIKSGLSADLTGANAMEGNRRHPGLFRNNGKQLDVLVQSLKERGYLTQADEDSILDNGGTNKLADMIQAELSGERAKLVDNTDGFEAMRDADMRDADMRQGMEDKATALGLSQDMVNSMSDSRLNGTIKRIEARLGHPIKTDFATRKMSRAEARAEREAILMADRYERARAKYDAELQVFAEADDMVQDAVLDVVVDEDGNVEIVYARAVEVAAASDALNGTWSDQNAEVDTRRVGAGQENSGQAGPPVASTAEADAGNPEANRSEASAGSQETLTTYTPEEVTAQQEAAEKAERTAKAKKQADDLSAKKEQERKEIAQASVAAADTFELGQDAMANLTGQNDLQFSRAAAKEVRDLVTLHNLSEDNLMYAGKMGGIPVPSIGITKVETPFGGFGEITLIAPKDLIDPEAGVPVYDRDAWTARFPALNFKKIKAKVADAFYERMQSVRDFGSDGGQFMSMLFEELRNSNVQAPDKITSLFTRYTAPKMLYAQEVLGKTIKPPMRDIKSETPFGHAKSWRDFVAKNYKAGMTEQQEKEFNRLAAVAARAAMAEINTENKARVDERTARMLDSSMNGYLDRYISENYGMNAGILDRAVRDVKSFGKKEIDPMKMDEAVRKVVPLDDAGYKKWVAGLVEPLFEAPTITVRGSEVPVTLENVVDAMTIGKTAGAEKSMTFGVGKAASMLGKQFKSIDEIKAARDRVVSTASESEGKKSTEALISEYQNHVSEFYTGKDWKGNIDTWAALDSSLEALTKAGRNPTDGTMSIALQRSGFKRVDAKGISLAKQALEALRDATTDYFEAKPQRAVRLNEFKGAVVPKGTSAEAIALLEENGITVEVHGNAEGAREKAIQKLAKKLDGKTGNVIFSRDTESPRTPASTIRAAITKAYGNLLSKLEAKGLVTIAQTEREAIEAAAQARADKTGGDAEAIAGRMMSMAGLDVKYSANGNIEGFFDRQTGKSFLVADNLTAASAPGTLMHEVGIHMAAGGKMEPLFKRAGSILKTGTQNEFIQRVKARMARAGETSAEEAAAYIVTEYENDRANAPASVAQWVKDFIADVRAWLFGKGVLLKADQLTVADIAAVARANVREMAFQRQSVENGAGNTYTASDANQSPTAQDITRVERLSALIAKTFGIEQPENESAYKAVSLPDAVALQSIGSAFGKRIIGFDLAAVLKGTKSPFSTVGGVSLSKVKDAIFINMVNDEPHLAVLGHELAHQMRMDEPAMYDELVTAIRPYVNQGVYRTEFGKELVAAHLTDDNLIREEFIGEVLSDGFMDARFWNALGKESPALLSRVFESVKTLIDKASSALGIRRKTEKYLTDFDKVMEIAGAAMARYGVDGDVSPSIRRSVAGPAQQPLPLNQPSPAWMLPESTKTDALVYELQDQKVDLKNTQSAILEAGRAITEPFDARMAETLMPGRVAFRTETFLKSEVAPLMEAMAKNNVSQNELSDYLLARHAPERNAQIAKVNPEMPDGGAGTNSQGVLMTTQAAQDHIAALTAGKRTVLQLLANKIDAITANTRNLLVTEGLEKQETMDAWTGAYKHYVPLFKDEAFESPAHPIGSGLSVTGSASKRATGSEGEVTNMVAHILMQRESAITRAEKNRVAMSLYGLALSNPNPDVWTTIRPNMRADKIGAELAAMGVDPVEAEQGMQGVPTIRTVNQTTGLVQDTPNPMYKRLENALVVKVGGEDRVVLFNAKNPTAMRMVRALKNQDGLTNFDIAGSIVGTATRYFASINTQYNPAFGMVNVVRDVGGALVNLTSTEISDKKAKVLGDIPAALKGIARDLRGDPQRTPWSDLWVQFQEDGGRTGYRDLFIDPFKRVEAVQKDFGRMQSDGSWSAGKVAHATLDLLDDFNSALENSVRLSAYKAALDSGLSRDRAAKLARELTVDFNRKGRTGRELGPLYAFFNASVQGTARTLEALKGPAGKKIIAGGLMLGVLQALMLAAADFDDDEPPEFVKARAFIIPMGDKRYVAIPLQFGLNALPNTGRVITELLMTGGKDIGEKSFNALGELLGSFNPLGGGNIFTAHGALTMVAPTVADPLIDLATNTNFAGRPIAAARSDWDTRPGDKLVRESTQRSATGQVYIGISKAINAMTGGNEFKRGLASPAPEQVQYVFHTVGGGMYRELEKTLNIAGLKADGMDVKTRMIPLGGRFAGEVDDQDTQRSRYFKNIKTLEGLEAELKGQRKAGNDAAVDELERERASDVNLIGTSNRISRSIAKLNKLAKESISDPEELKSLDTERLELMRELNEAVREAEKKAK